VTACHAFAAPTLPQVFSHGGVGAAKACHPEPHFPYGMDLFLDAAPRQPRLRGCFLTQAARAVPRRRRLDRFGTSPAAYGTAITFPFDSGLGPNAFSRPRSILSHRMRLQPSVLASGACKRPGRDRAFARPARPSPLIANNLGHQQGRRLGPALCLDGFRQRNEVCDTQAHESSRLGPQGAPDT
jgi:hypothetical protein